MPTTITGNDITINGVSQIADSKVVQVHVARNSTRNSDIPQNPSAGVGAILWNAHSFSRVLSNSLIRVEAHLKGYDDWSYPFFGTFVELVRPNGTTIKSFVGSSYNHHSWVNGGRGGDNGQVNWWVKKAFTPAEIGIVTGSGFTIRYGYQASNEGGNRPFVRWNFNNNDDGRAFQQVSNSTLYEYTPN